MDSLIQPLQHLLSIVTAEDGHVSSETERRLSEAVRPVWHSENYATLEATFELLKDFLGQVGPEFNSVMLGRLLQLLDVTEVEIQYLSENQPVNGIKPWSDEYMFLCAYPDSDYITDADLLQRVQELDPHLLTDKTQGFYRGLEGRLRRLGMTRSARAYSRGSCLTNNGRYTRDELQRRTARAE